LAEHNLEMPLLVAPTTSRERAKLIVEHASGFVYVVARLGVTGVGTTMTVDPIRQKVATLREITKKPLAVGFGVSKPEHARLVASFADGIIVGSAMIESYLGYQRDEAAAKARAFAQSIVAASTHP
jgi:tryptophan synthase alpha chain